MTFSSLLSRKEYIFIFLFFLAVLAFLYYTFFTSNYYDRDAPVRFEIVRGETLNRIIDKLHSEEVIPSKFYMKAASFIYGAEKKIRAGRYYIPNGLSYVELVEYLMYGDADFLREVSIYNGVSTKWIASKLRIDAGIDSASFIELAGNSGYLKKSGMNIVSMDGYLLPDKYYFYERSSPQEVLDTFYTRFNNFFTDSMRTAAAAAGLSVNEVIILASIVEGETNMQDEMPVVAGVYLNRLKVGMKLQADPTVQFLQEGGWKRLLYKDLEIDSPYNTYKYFGLPPGPINNPGRKAILSVIYPEDHNYFYFVADGKGGHKFASSLQEHNRNVAEYRKMMNELRKKEKQNK